MILLSFSSFPHRPYPLPSLSGFQLPLPFLFPLHPFSSLSPALPSSPQFSSPPFPIPSLPTPVLLPFLSSFIPSFSSFFTFVFLLQLSSLSLPFPSESSSTLPIRSLSSPFPLLPSFPSFFPLSRCPSLCYKDTFPVTLINQRLR